MSKAWVYFLLLLAFTGFAIADYHKSVPPDHQALEQWRPAQFNSCAPCGAPCRRPSSAEE